MDAEAYWKRVEEFLRSGRLSPLLIDVPFVAPSTSSDEYLFYLAPEEPLPVPEEVLQVAKRLQEYIPPKIKKLLIRKTMEVTVYGVDGFSNDILPYRLDNLLAIFLLWWVLKEMGVDFLEEAEKKLRMIEETLQKLHRTMDLLNVIIEMVGL